MNGYKIKISKKKKKKNKNQHATIDKAKQNFDACFINILKYIKYLRNYFH